MKIDNVSINNVIGAYQNDLLSSAKNDAGRQTDKTRTVKSDRVEFSTRITEIEKLRNTADAMPDVRSDKIAALKEQISGGTYRIDSAKVAAKMLGQSKWSGFEGGSN